MAKSLQEVESDLIAAIASLKEDVKGADGTEADDITEEIYSLDEYLQEIRASLRWNHPGDYR